jgi:hypothetical protein
MKRQRSEYHKALDGFDEQSSKANVGIITHPFLARAGKTPLDNLISVTRPLTNRLFVITSEDYDTTTESVELIRVKAVRRTSFISRVFEQALVHVRVLHVLLNLYKDIDILIFFLGTAFPVPLVFAQALGIKCFIILVDLGPGKHMQSTKQARSPGQFGELTRLYLSEILQRISYYFADKLIVYSPSVIDQVKLERYADKITIAHRHFVNLDQFRYKNDIEQRSNVVGYVGRLNVEKGILNFVHAIPKVLEAHADTTFLIVGEGVLEDRIRNYLQANGLNSKVEMTGWIPHDELPDYLHRMKLLTLPSFNEGLPNVILESMACGTPVIATPVGSIPDVLIDGENGFLIDDNSPAALAESIVRALQRPQLQQIAVNARTLVETEFRYEKLIKTWESIICEEEDKKV